MACKIAGLPWNPNGLMQISVEQAHSAVHSAMQPVRTTNNHRPLPVRLAGLLVLCGLSATASAQGKKGALAKDFDKLPAKERTRIAARETRESAEDTAYLAVMHRGDQAFQAGQFEAALAAFQEARNLRPYNVYPKVKIEDLQALISKRAAEQAAPSPPASGPEVPGAGAAVEPVPPPAQRAAAPTPAQAPPPRAQAAQPPPVAAPANHPPAARQEMAPPPALGERIYKEAGAVVTERTVEDNGKPVTYKKVVHPWGQTFYFKDGLSIPAGQWSGRFSQ